MARVSASITPDLLSDGYNREIMYNLNGTDPNGGTEDIETEENDDVEVSQSKLLCFKRY